MDAANSNIDLVESIGINDNSEIESSEEGEILEVDGSELVFEIKFCNKNGYGQLGAKIVDALQRAINTEATKYEFSFTEERNCIQVFHSATQINSIAMPPSSPLPSEKPESPDFNVSTLFMVDTSPADNLDKASVPSYKRSIKETMNGNSDCKKQEDIVNNCAKPPRAGSQCFNCGSKDHELRDCPKPRNNMRIMRAKKNFSNKQERYHVDNEQIYSHLRPGVIREDLQTALGLRKGEIPFFFYRMRLLGYPPGWLEDAKVLNSGISLFNSNGDKVGQSDEDEHKESSNVKYNIARIIDFPGFNTNPGKNFYDDFEHHNVPPMDPKQMKNEFLKTLGENNVIKGYKRRKLKDPHSGGINQKSKCESFIEETDMDLEDDEPKLMINSHLSPVSVPENQDSFLILKSSETETLNVSPEIDCIQNRANSPSIADLEEKKQQLLLALNSDTSKNANKHEHSYENDNIPRGRQSPHNVLEEPNLTHNENSLQTDGDCQCPSPSTPLPNSMKEKDLITASHAGTPILKFSPYNSLPNDDNFKVGVSDVINFENLPDSTGKYEQMKTVIKKVRNIITQLNSED